ncbi:protein ALP1-like [Daphnia magna]|uniref:Uncharacterized protein n=2 Tax=Daphnia magna TaxID=35525 RepID=A0ABR0ABJ8_9CRUS|nr:protein ALP1-like [Daphnia magna]KAK4022511.1 hypothetical protein OUZ56_007976 [Daphnia magna]KZS09426.1 TE: Transposase [Daphnia magna]
MKISDESPPSMLPEELASTMPPEMVMQLIQVSSAFLVTLNSYVASTREIDRRSRRLRRSRMLLLMRLMQLREDKSQRLLAAPPPVPIPLPIPRIVKPPPAGNKFWEREVPRFSEAQFQKEFHVSKRTFNYLCNALRPTLSKRDANLRAHVPLEKRVGVALGLLASKNEYKNDYSVIAHTFGISKSSVAIIFKQFCNAVVDILFGKVVQLPSGPGFREEADKFELRYLFPDTIGVVGATHLPVATPRNCGAGYTNSSGWNSIVLLGVAGYNNKLGYVCIGQPGSTDNTAVLKASQLYKTAQKGKLFPADEDLHFLADHTFPLQNWLLTPYRMDEVCDRESYKTLNQHLKNAHKCVETSFERLKGRWGLLLKGCDLAMDFTKVVQVCCVLHNLCEEAGDMFFEHWYGTVRTFDAAHPQPKSKAAPAHIRDEDDEDEEDEEEYEEMLAEAGAKRDRLSERLIVSAAAAAASQAATALPPLALSRPDDRRNSFPSPLTEHSFSQDDSDMY